MGLNELLFSNNITKIKKISTQIVFLSTLSGAVWRREILFFTDYESSINRYQPHKRKPISRFVDKRVNCIQLAARTEFRTIKNC